MRVHVLRRPGLDPRARARLRPLRRQHLLRGAGSRRASEPSLVLDAGTGIRGLTALLGEAPFRGAVLLGHLHWDHTQGLPFSRGPSTTTEPRCACASPIRRMALGGRRPAPGHVAAALPDRARGPAGGVDLRRARARCPPDRAASRCSPWRSRTRAGGPSATGSATGARSIAYLSDHGPASLGPGPDGWGPYHDAAMALAADVDLLIHDAQHTADELPSRAHFGHSAADYAVRLGEVAGARSVLLFHHDPNAHRRRGRRHGGRLRRGSRPGHGRLRRRDDRALTRPTC